MIYELREYRAIPGQLPHLLQRFEQKVLPIWERHGIRPVGFWTTLIGTAANVSLHYMVEWASLAEREEKWTAFVNDPEWILIRDTSEQDGPYVGEFSNTILKPTSFSTMQ
ncbi:NIPSNAP family protein [Alcaligenaceae bacterium]|nr:NIPSNAP family protein [Alcaligenaceae bacterium]